MTVINAKYHYMKLLLLFAVMFCSACMFYPNNKTVNIKLNPNKSGWYFMEIIRDSSLKDTGTVYTQFDDTIRLVSVRINHIDQTILSPYDYAGNSLSSRLKYLGLLGAKGRSFFEFYNPTDEELINIDKWMPSNNRAWQIRLDENKEFDKYFKKRNN